MLIVVVTVMAYSYGDDTVTAGGVVSPEATSDHEEKEQCIKMHEIIAQYKLDGEFRYGLKLTLSNQSCKHARKSGIPWANCRIYTRMGEEWSTVSFPCSVVCQLYSSGTPLCLVSAATR